MNKYLLGLLMIVGSMVCEASGKNSSGWCYRGMLDLGYGYGFKAGDFLTNSDNFEISTTHGYMFSQYLFVGVGANLQIVGSYGEELDFCGYIERGLRKCLCTDA